MKRIVLIAALTAACGGTSHSAVERNRAGSGTSTLRVTASVDVTNSATAPVTNYQIDLRDGLGAIVSGATVTVHDSGQGDVALTEATAGTGRYTASKSALPGGDLSLQVVQGADAVSGVVVGYPGAHSLSAPALNATVTANQPLDLSWTTPTMAKAATITTRDYTIQVPDTGSYAIPAANNPPRANQRVIMARTNEVDVGGALPTSRLRVTVTTTVDPFSVQ
jgi:hypothetical protein